MEVKNKKMYHYHKTGIYDELWIPGNNIRVDNNFITNFSRILDKFNTAVNLTSGGREAFNYVISEYLKTPQTEEEYIQLLKEAERIIYDTNIFKRELALETVRKEKYPHLPSRTHSIWVTDKKGIEFWKQALVHPNSQRKLALFEVSLTGNLFKTSDYFIPENELTYEQIIIAADKYWNPNYSTVLADRSEYLFQGDVKVIKKIK